MTNFRLSLANPCQNEESKQKKHDKRNKINANEMSVQHVPLIWNVADPIKPLNSYSAQNNFDIIIWNGSCLVVAWPMHIVTGVKRKRINWIL